MIAKTAETIDAQLAARLRQEREARNWSLADLSARSGVSRAMIHKVERGESSPTASLLGRLSGAFGLSMSALLARAEASTAGRLVRAAERPAWRDPASGYTRRQIFPAPGSDYPVDVVKVELPKGASVSFSASSYAFTRQAIFMLDGELTFIEGETAHRLGEGDSLELGAPADCTFRNASRATCTYLVVVARA
jgi:transcriptional regulator with XRE-family HTH domain